MKKAQEIVLGIVTSIGGFLEIGSLSTAVQAGAAFRFQLVWAVLLGTLCLIFLVEMAGRFAAVSKHTVTDALRERFGFNFFSFVFLGVTLVDLLVLGAEIGGVSLALQLLTGIALRWWAVPVGLAVWLLLWKGSFGLIEKGASLLGLVTLCLVVGAVLLHPPWRQVAAGALPSLPQGESAHYWFLAVSILGASISPYLFFFYSAGAIEDRWDEGYLGTNRAVSGLGMSFGALIALSALVLAAGVFGPRGITQLDSYDQIALLLTPVLGRWGFWLFAASLGIACFGAALEIALEIAYRAAQGFGWNWGEDLKPADDAGFATVYTLALVFGVLLVVVGLDPLKLTVFSMALTAATLPLSVVPFLVLMNDERYMGEHRNGRLSNAVVLFIVALSFVLAVVSIPLELLGGS
jgi:Mn2+/Fe2+ NRAMP family transporter